MASSVWVQVDPSLDRDAVPQYFKSTVTGIRVYGRTSGFDSDHIHLYFPATNTDSGLNMDPNSGDVSKDGNILADALAVGILAVEALAGGALGATDAAVDTAKHFMGPDGKPIDLTGLIFPAA